MVYPYYDSHVRYYNQHSIVPFHHSMEDGVDASNQPIVEIFSTVANFDFFAFQSPLRSHRGKQG